MRVGGWVSAAGMQRGRERIEERLGHIKVRERRPSAKSVEIQDEAVCNGPSQRKTEMLSHVEHVLGATRP